MSSSLTGLAEGQEAKVVFLRIDGALQQRHVLRLSFETEPQEATGRPGAGLEASKWQPLKYTQMLLKHEQPLAPRELQAVAWGGREGQGGVTRVCLSEAGSCPGSCHRCSWLQGLGAPSQCLDPGLTGIFGQGTQNLGSRA